MSHVLHTLKLKAKLKREYTEVDIFLYRQTEIQCSGHHIQNLLEFLIIILLDSGQSQIKYDTVVHCSVCMCIQFNNLTV